MKCGKKEQKDKSDYEKIITNFMVVVPNSCYQCCCNICGADDVNYFSNTDHGGACGEYESKNYDKNKEFFCYCYHR